MESEVLYAGTAVKGAEHRIHGRPLTTVPAHSRAAFKRKQQKTAVSTAINQRNKRKAFRRDHREKKV